MTKEIPLANRRGFALIDDEDFERVSQIKWFLLPKGYVAANTPYVNGKRTALYLHRFVYPTSARHVDHKNRNKLDCRKENLRPANGTQNAANSGLRRDNTSGYKGVHWRKDGQKWVAQISDHLAGKKRRIGDFETVIEAARAYDREARRLFGEFAYLNFPDEGPNPTPGGPAPEER